MTNPYPVELPNSSLPSISPGQAAAIYRAPFVGHVNKVPRLGAAIPTNIFNAVGLWYWNNVPFGDWSGTSQVIDEAGNFGSGGPAACPYSTCGAHTIVCAGVHKEVTGHDATTSLSFGLETDWFANPSTTSPYSDWTYTLAVRKKTAQVLSYRTDASPGSKIQAGVPGDPAIPDCAWDASTGVLTAPTGEDFDDFTFTGDDWCLVASVDPQPDRTSFPVETGTATAGGASTLTDSGKSWSTGGGGQWTGYEVYIAVGTGAGQRRFVASNTSTALTVSVAWDIQPDTDSIYELRPSNVVGRPGWYRISAASSSTITLTSDARNIVHESDIAAGVSIIIVQSAQAKYITGVDYIDTVSIDGASLKTSSYIEENDTLEIGSVTYTFKGTPSAPTDIAVVPPTHESGGWTNSERNTQIDNILAQLQSHPEVEVVSEENASIVLRAKTQAQYDVILTLNAGSGLSISADYVSRGKLYSSTSSFAALASDDDTVEVISGSSNITRSHAHIDSTSSSIMWIDEEDFEIAATDDSLTVIQWLRWPFVQKTLVLDETLGAENSATVTDSVPVTMTLSANMEIGDTIRVVGGTAGNADRISKTYTMIVNGGSPTATQIALGTTADNTCTAIATKINSDYGDYFLSTPSGSTVEFEAGPDMFPSTTYTVTKQSNAVSFGWVTSGNRVAYATALSGNGWTDPIIKRGDPYIVWATNVTEYDQVQTSNPESVPTISQRTNTSCWWPYGTPNRSTRQSYRGNYPNAFASDPGSQMNSAWAGTFFVPRDLWVAGDKLEITCLADLQLFGTPCIVEVLLIPGFDPEADWYKRGDTDASARLLGLNGKVMWFQSPIILEGESNGGFQVTLHGQAGSVQTVGTLEQGDNYSQQWTAEFEFYGNSIMGAVGGTGGGANEQGRNFPAVIGPVAHISLPNIEAYASLGYEWTMLITTKHPSEKNSPGYHGYYGGEPYSCLTGNGGTLLTYKGQTSTILSAGNSQFYPPLPYGGSFRVAAVNVIHIPGGSY